MTMATRLSSTSTVCLATQGRILRLVRRRTALRALLDGETTYGTLSTDGQINMIIPRPKRGSSPTVHEFVGNECGKVLIEPADPTPRVFMVDLTFNLGSYFYLTPKYYKWVDEPYEGEFTWLVYFWQDTQIKGSCINPGHDYIFGGLEITDFLWSIDIEAQDGWSYIREHITEDLVSWTSVPDPGDEWYLEGTGSN
jgi:hypothetical protein